MNREINFRGKRVNSGELIYGDLWHNSDTYRIMWEECDDKINSLNSIKQVSYQVDPSSIEQAVGRKDKNGKMIFDGDKLKITYTYYFESGSFKRKHTVTVIGYVKYSVDSISWELIAEDGDFIDNLAEFIDLEDVTFEVIENLDEEHKKNE